MDTNKEKRKATSAENDVYANAANMVDKMADAIRDSRAKVLNKTETKKVKLVTAEFTDSEEAVRFIGEVMPKGLECDSREIRTVRIGDGDREWPLAEAERAGSIVRLEAAGILDHPRYGAVVREAWDRIW